MQRRMLNSHVIITQRRKLVRPPPAHDHSCVEVWHQWQCPSRNRQLERSLATVAVKELETYLVIYPRNEQEVRET